MSEEKTYTETIKTTGDNAVAKVKELVREGNVRRITIKNDEGQTLLEIPVTVGVVGVVLLPMFAAVGAVAAMLDMCIIEVVRVEE